MPWTLSLGRLERNSVLVINKITFPIYFTFDKNIYRVCFYEKLHICRFLYDWLFL